MSEISNLAKSDDEEVAAESTDGNEQESTDTGTEQDGGKQRLSKEERRIKREMARVKMETIAPVNWDVDKIFKGLEKPRDVTAAVLRVLARHDIIHRENTLRRYKAALAHCINSKPTRIPGVRAKRAHNKPTLEGLSCIPVTEYDYKILQAAKFFRIKVTTLNKLLIELEALVPSKNTPPLLEPAELTESECSNDEEDEGDSSDETKKEPEEDELNWPVGMEEEDSETEGETEKMPSIVRCDVVDVVDDDVGTESADDEPVEEAVWDRPMDEGTTFGGDYLDKTKSKHERLRSFVWQVMYHVTDEDGRQCIEWMIKSMLDPKEFAKIPSIYHKTKVLEFYKVILPSLCMSEDFYPVRTDFAPLCGTRTLRFNRGPGLLDSDDEKGEVDDEEEDDLHWMKVLEEARKEREEYARERDIRREMGIPSDSDDWPESGDEDGKKEEEDEEEDVEGIDEEETSGGKTSTEGESERSKEGRKERDTATEDSTTDSPYADYSDDVTSSMGGTDDRDETPGESGGDADDEESTPQEYHDYEDYGEDADHTYARRSLLTYGDVYDDEDTVEEGGDEDDDDVEWMGADGKTIEKRTREEERGKETVEKEDEEIEVIEVEKRKKMRKAEERRRKEEEEVDVDVITLDGEDDDDDYHSAASRPPSDATPVVSPPPLIPPPLPASPVDDGTEEEEEGGYETPMEGKEEREGGGGGLAMNEMKKGHGEEEEDNDVTLIEPPPPTSNGDARDDSPASPEPDDRSYGDGDDDDEVDWEVKDDHDYCVLAPLQRVRRPQHTPIEMTQPSTPPEPERKKRKVIDDDEDDEEREEEKQPVRRRSMRGKASPAPIPLPKRSNGRKKKEEKEVVVVERVTIKEEVVDEGEEEEAQTSNGKRGRGRPKKVSSPPKMRSFLQLWKEKVVLPTPTMDKTGEEGEEMDGNEMGASEKETTPAVQQRPTRGRREIKVEVPDEDDDDGVTVVAVAPSVGGSSRASSTRGRTPRGRTPAKLKATTPVPARGRTPRGRTPAKTPVKQKATTPVPAKEDKKSAAQKRKETMERTMENAKLIMAMNKDFTGSGPTTPDQSSTGKTRGRPRGGGSSSSTTVKKEVDEDGDDVAIVDSSVASSSGGTLRRSTRGRPPAKELESTPDLSVSSARRGVGRPRIIKLEVKEEVVDAEEKDVSSTVSSSSQRRQPRGRTPGGRTPAKQMDVEDVSNTVSSSQRRGRTPGGGGGTSADEGPNTVSSSQRKPRGRTPAAKTPVAKQKETTPPEPKNKRNRGEEGGKRVEVKSVDGDDEEVKIIGTVRKSRGRTPAKQKSSTPAAATQPPVKGVNRERKQVDLMALVSTAEERSKPSTPDMARVKGSGADEKGMSDRKRSLRGHKEEAKKAVEVIDLEDDEEEKKEEEEAPKQQSDQRRRSLRAGTLAVKSPVKSKKNEEKMEQLKSKEEPAKAEEKPAPKKSTTRKSGPVASFSMPPAQPRRRSQK